MSRLTKMAAWVCRKEDRVRFHQSSVLAPANMVGSNTHANAVRIVPTDWMIFEEMTRAHRLAHVKCCTAVSPMTLAIFAGPAKLSLDAIKEAESGVHGKDSTIEVGYPLPPSILSTVSNQIKSKSKYF